MGISVLRRARALHLLFGLPYERVTRYHRSHLHPDELTVVFFLARRARVSPETVIALRSFIG